MTLKNSLERKFIFIQKLRGVKNLNTTLSNRKKIKEAFANFENQKYISISEENLQIFKKAFLKFIWYQPKEAEIPLLFTKCEIEPDKLSSIKLGKYDPILVCVEKNDIDRMKMLFNHYRNLGIKRFVIIDNESTDETIEYLRKQKDVDLYICHTKYSTLNKEAWANRIFAHYGFDKWYLYVDSDELFIYEDCENKKINDFIEELEKSKQRRVSALMTEMYSQEGIFSNTEDKDIRAKYCYYDTDTYTFAEKSPCNALFGGPRKRVFGLNPILIKHPLFKLKRGDIQALSHWQFPYKDNYHLKIKGALLHYKFLNRDLERYTKIAKEGNYATGSLEYKTYISAYQKNPQISLYSQEHSKKYTNSKDFFDSLKIKKER